MKRCFENTPSDVNEYETTHKVALVEMESTPGGVALVNSDKVFKKTHVELMELEESVQHAHTSLNAITVNKLDVIGRQMQHLQGLMNDVIQKSKLDNELHHAACNFVKKPGHVYHLYERPSGQKYFSMLSPEEWVNVPHRFLGSFRLDLDQSWSPAGKEQLKYEGIAFLKNVYLNPLSTKAKLNLIA